MMEARTRRCKPKRKTGRTRGSKEDTRKNEGGKKGSKLPDVKFFATNQRGDN